MKALKRISLFVKNYITQFKRKFLLLPLIFILPLFMIGSIIISIALLIYPDENDPIKIGVVDYDQSTETDAVIHLLEQSSEFGPFISIESMPENKAETQIANDNLSAYIVFPEQFTNDLYVGNSVTLNVIGNEKRATESQLVKELLDSMMRHIRTSQASILMVNEHAKTLGINATERETLIFNLFQQSFLNVMGKDNVLSEKQLTNYATTKTFEYYLLAIVFILIVVWLVIIYNVIYTKESKRLLERMKLYGVTEYEQIIARFIVTLLIMTSFVAILTIVLNYFVIFELYIEDIVRMSLLILLTSIIFLQLLAFCEMVISSDRVRLLTQLLCTVLFLIFSGAILPTIYLPLFMQQLITYIPSYHSFYWLQEIILNERLYASFKLLIIYVISGFVLLGGVSFVKERVNE